MFLPDLLKGKRILITGGGSGLGKSMAARFLDLGADVVICGRREDVLKATVAELDKAAPGRIAAVPLDVRDPVAVEAAVDALWAQGPLDALVNNAAGNILSRTEDLSHRAMDSVIGIVLHGSAYMTLACGKRWIRDGRAGNVLSIVTTYAWTGSGYVVPSAMAKAGVLAMTRSLAVEWGPKNIRLNAIAPGPFPTEGAWSRLVPRADLDRLWSKRIPLGRFGRHEELTDLAAYLLCDRSGYITGDVVTIDGGEWLKGAGQFNFAEMLTDAEWQAFRGKVKK
ncbi:MAG: SDR family oxidoreductase [Alphaproteobacteria bacterium]|nr:SDR family oxidoreductase [Alphaproteobacteria bacterium]